jgi:filamentous hemagglutinin family protein
MKSLFENLKSFWFAALIFSIGRTSNVFANPTGLNVVSGNATAQAAGSQLNVTVGQTAILNWQSFNIQNGETTRFLQPSSDSIVFNVIGGANPSQIFGNLNANGTVILANANGFYFGPDSMIKVGGSFIATTAPLPPDFGSGGMWSFTGMPPLASIVNYGQIEAGNGKSLYLIAEKIENHGSLNAPGGDIELAAGSEVLVSDSPDGRGLSASVKLPQGSVDNFGRITADAGTITLQAKVVNQNGIIQADSLAEKNGVIELVASDELNLGANSQILARGDDSAFGSAGGHVTLKSENIFSDADGSQIVTTGGANGGNGGNVEVSAPNILSLNTAMDAGAFAGFTGGEFLLDPANIVLGTSGSGTVPATGTVDSSGSGTLSLNVNTAFLNKNFSNIKLQATGNITLNAGTTWDLSTSTGLTSGQLTLQAGGDIIFGDKSKIFDANDWSVSLYAGYSFISGAVQSGVGNIYLNGGSGLTKNGTIQLSAGDINLFAGQSILVAPVNSSVVSGSIFTTGGGNIFAYAMAGDIVAGNSNGGTSSTSQTSDYNFTDSGATPNPYLGGISTAAGGNVTLIADNNIDSTPKVPSRQAPGASGAYGSGNVTVIAGNQITGNYTLADGIGTMIAGVQVQGSQAAVLQNPGADASAYAATLNELVATVKQSQNVNGNIGAAPVSGNPSTAPVTLSVINGTWNAFAANDISIKEVNNPNGAFNVSQSFLFNYAADAAANFWAGNAIELIGANLGRLTSVNRTPIYAPILSLNAGAGGIKIDKSILLAPSSEGSLTIITRDGGDLSGAVVSGSTVLNGITMSDSSSSDYTTFASEHDNIHLNDPNPQPVYLDISGSINSFSLTVPTFANITVHGDTYNFGFKGRNLSADQTTSINVLGAITYRGNLTALDLTVAQLADALPPALFTASADTSVTSRLRYDATTGKLIFVGVMSASDLAFLLHPSVFVLDQNGKVVTQPALDASGNPNLDANGNPTTVPVTKSLTLDATQQEMINQLYAASQSASLGDQGLALAGPGNFNVSANRMDLGVSGGIRVIAPDPALAAISLYGANLNVTTLGDLTMTSTKIANESLLGNVNVNVGGALDVGGQFTTLGDASAPKGIFTTSGGSVSITAGSDVNVNGSRIAAYNGGDVFVESLHGDVNAGTGGAGYVNMSALELDPVTGLLTSIPATIPGSGILATTVFGSHAQLGNITIQAPEGSLNASLGGIIQIAFNGADAHKSFIDVSVGKDINASGSGIIGSNIRLQAGGDINGVIIGSQSININAHQNVDVTAVSGGNVDINASGSVAGTIIGGGNVSVSGDAISAAVEGGTVSASGDTSGASLGVPASNVAKENTEVADNASTTASKTDSGNDEDPLKKKKGIALAQKVSRVTVLLPTRN